MTDRMPSIQALRAIAALLVLVAHVWGPFATFGQPDLIPNFVAGAAGVDLFFVISGFVMVYSSERYFGQRGGAMQFFLNRLARIAPLYWAATTVALLVGLRYHGPLAADDLTPWNAIASYFFIPTERPSGAMHPLHGVGWSLNYEMFFYVVFAVAVLLPRRKAVIAATISLVALMFTSQLVPLPRSVGYLATPFLWEFAFGMVIGLAYRERLRLPQWIAAILVVSGIAVYCWSCTLEITHEVAGWRHWLWGGPAAFGVAGLTLSSLRVDWRPLNVIGDASYALYLTHSLTIEMVHLKFARYMAPLAHPFLYVGFEIALAIGIAIAVYRLEKPLTAYLKSKIRIRPAYISTSTVSAEKLFP